jgi:hypothetical protein
MQRVSAGRRDGCVDGGVHLHVAVAVKDHDYDHDPDDAHDDSHGHMQPTCTNAR